MPRLSSVLSPPARMPPEAAPAPYQPYGGWFPKWVEKRDICPEEEGKGPCY